MRRNENANCNQPASPLSSKSARMGSACLDGNRFHRGNDPLTSSGIGAISNLSNSYPWGFWISFDLFTGIAIRSGAFVLASLVYIFELKEFRPLVRPTLLTGFLGYIMEVIALLVDLGHPERIWYMT